MLKLTIPASEYFDEENQLFIEIEAATIELEHSLVSLSKWEERFEKPFLGPGEKTIGETLAYVEAMCLTPDVSPLVFKNLTNDNLKTINAYIESKMTATTFREIPGQSKRSSGEVITAELIYYWMMANSIPLECENWHLSKLFTLLKVFNVKNAPQKKMSRRDAAAQQRALNAQRRSQLGHSG